MHVRIVERDPPAPLSRSIGCCEQPMEHVFYQAPEAARSSGAPFLRSVTPLDNLATSGQMGSGGKTPRARLTNQPRETRDPIKTYMRLDHGPRGRTGLAHHPSLAEATRVTDQRAPRTDAGCTESLSNANSGSGVLEQALPLIGRIAEVAIGNRIVRESHILKRIPTAIADQVPRKPDCLQTGEGDSQELTGVTGRSIIVVRKTGKAQTPGLVVARFGDEVVLQHVGRIDIRQVGLRPEGPNRAHRVIGYDLAKQVLEMEAVLVGARIKGLDDTESTTRAKTRHQGIPHEREAAPAGAEGGFCPGTTHRRRPPRSTFPRLRRFVRASEIERSLTPCGPKC